MGDFSIDLERYLNECQLRQTQSVPDLQLQLSGTDSTALHSSLAKAILNGLTTVFSPAKPNQDRKASNV